MSQNPFAPAYDDLPDILPIFPLAGALLLPYGKLPLNIFEPRYRAMVEDAMAGARMIGMVQPDPETGKQAVYQTGCAGKITEFSETGDGRYLITLSGICRFQIRKEIAEEKGYRRVKPNWAAYMNDLNEQVCNSLDRKRLQELLRKYFDKEGMNCDWGAVEGAPDSKLITCLSMVCPFTPQEKQALLEAPCCSTRASVFITVLEMAVCDGGQCKSCH